MMRPILLAGGVLLIAQLLKSRPLIPLPNDVTGAQIMTSTATGLGLMVPERMQARATSPVRVEMDLAQLKEGLRAKGYSMTAEQLASAKFMLGGVL